MNSTKLKREVDHLAWHHFDRRAKGQKAYTQQGKPSCERCFRIVRLLGRHSPLQKPRLHELFLAAYRKYDPKHRGKEAPAPTDPEAAS